MNELPSLRDAAYKSELAASRRLAASAGIPNDQALRRILEAIAGADGLSALLAQRDALRSAASARKAARKASREAQRVLRAARHEGEPTAWRAWFDGSARPNPGCCGIGGLLKGPGSEVIEIALPAGYGNSSEAEYRALIALLEAAVRHRAHQLTIYGDSQVVVNDMNGVQPAPALLAYREAAHTLLSQLRDVRLRWVPRHKNHEADALAQRGAAAPLAVASLP
jgi:ribonuclease HI